MKKKIYETIIIGCGISGLGCAHTLKDNNKDFLVITEDIGGRICTSSDGKVNYGAYFVTYDYKHMKKLVTKGRKIRFKDITFHNGRKRYRFFNRQIIKYIPQLIKLTFHLLKFRRAYGIFKKNCEHMSQKEALEQDPYLKSLYKKKTIDFLKEQHIEGVVNKYIHEVLYAMSFVSDQKPSAFSFLQWTYQLFLLPVNEFSLDKNMTILPFRKNIIRDTVLKIGKKGDNYLIKTRNKKFIARNIVVATPPWISKNLLHLEKIDKTINAYMFHVKGSIREGWDETDDQFFDPHSRTCVISHQTDGSYLVYTKNKNVDLNNYFSSFDIISQKHWKPAFTYPEDLMLDCIQGKNLYLIGDHNIGGMEDSYITGIYAANQIIKNNLSQE
ncbi:NAD(P)-binding protein [Candidatus Woesearchaeota archaeon]|nr:NAD(P)-binding protein [Candidatus Woesearchaeota archaeon]